jgi:hypothetical protein
MWSSVRVALAASLWVVAVLLMVVATVDGYKVVFAGWSILAAMAGCVFIVWQLLAAERMRVATIAQLLEQQRHQNEDQGLRRV